ncbi:MAG: hypothetical protein R6X32_22035 [Chloroflexota bacterium]|jgi:LPXTG-motif cell wall-anchored protein
MSEEYLIEEEEGGGSAGSRTFTILAGIASAVLLLGLICIAAIMFTRQQDTTQADAVAMRETENAIILVTNEAVTRTIEAMETEAARPTETPTSTPEPSPTNTPEPTETPVVLPVDEEEETATPDSLATAIAEADFEDDDVTPGAPGVPGASATAVPGTGVDTLPDTGINTLGIIVAAFMLLGLSVVARRLRSS